MSVKITYFVPGTTIDQEQHISSGWNDVELSEEGISQAWELTELTDASKFDVVFCSNLKRAIDSAEITWGGTYSIMQDARLRGCNYGDLNGQSEEVVEKTFAGAISTPFPNGESLEMVQVRMESFLKHLKANFDGKHVAIVGHRAPQLALEVILNGVTWEDAIAADWRTAKAWKPGFEYAVV
jgi:broad specificity phosphatase PhoE